MKQFIIFTDEELDKMKSGQLIVCENCDFSESGDDKPYDIFCTSLSLIEKRVKNV